MKLTRRTLLISGAAIAGASSLNLSMAQAAAHGADTYPTASGQITVHPVDHATVIFETPGPVIYVDPVGDAATYADYPAPDMILITHEHGDHFNVDTLTALAGQGVPILVNPAVYEKLPEGLKAQAAQIANGESTELQGIGIEAIPAYNITEDRLNFHPQGRDNGYVLTIDGLRVYLSGDTEATPEMRALQNIDVAFVCMNLPFTMGIEQAASGVQEFKPAVVYPYHYRNKDKTFSDLEAFAKIVGDDTEVKTGNWYNGADHV